MKLLIADDSKIFRQRMKKMISSFSEIKTIIETSTIEETLKAITQYSPDLLSLDLNMPDGSGIDILKALKDENSIPVVIILTNYSDTIYRNECIQLGADYFFDKSTEFIKVRKVINDLINDQSSFG